MKNKKLLVVAGIVFLIGVLLVVAVIAFRFGTSGNRDADENLFGNTTTVRDEPLIEDEGIVGVQGGGSYWRDGSSQDSTLPALRMLSEEPVAGATSVLVEPSGYAPEQYARYIERSTGHVKDVRIDRINPSDSVRVDTMLRIGRVYWSPNGTTSLIQRLDADALKIYSYLTTFGLSFAPPEASSTATSTQPETPAMPATNGRHIEFDSVVTAAISPDARSVFYIVKNDTGSVGYVESVVLGIRREIWRSPLRSLTTRWDTQSGILLYTNPSSEMLGYVWMIDPETGTQTQLAGNEYALAARMNPLGTRLLYSVREAGSQITTLRVYSLDMKTTTYLPQTMGAPVEKCAWDAYYTDFVYCAVPRNIASLNYLEDWYMGALSSDDVVWQINTATGEAYQILDPVELTTDSFDIIDLEVSPLGDFLIFKTKMDDMLWAATIPQERLPVLVDESASTTEPTVESLESIE